MVTGSGKATDLAFGDGLYMFILLYTTHVCQRWDCFWIGFVTLYIYIYIYIYVRMLNIEKPVLVRMLWKIQILRTKNKDEYVYVYIYIHIPYIWINYKIHPHEKFGHLGTVFLTNHLCSDVAEVIVNRYYLSISFIYIYIYYIIIYVCVSVCVCMYAFTYLCI